jgi:uncharacterized coiled-coil protein SlyX
MAEKEEAKRLENIESLLSVAQNTINDLTEVVSNKDVELATSSEDVTTLKAKIEELEAKTAEFEAKLVDADKTSEELTERATTAEKELASIEADCALTERMTELEEAKVAAPGESREPQEERVRTMNNEEFAAYKTERVELRTQLETELKEAAAVEAAAAAKAAEGDEGETAEEKAKREEAAAAVEAASILNVEFASEDLISKYRKLGEGLAARMRNDQE